MKFAMDKILGIINFLGANGAGPSSGTNKEINGSWLTELLAWLGDAIVKLATVVWGWLITIFYFVVRFCLNLIDILQMFVEKLVGIEMYNQEGGISAVKDLQDTDLIIRFITNETILKAFRTIMVLGLILLIIFSIIALIKQNYQSAITDGADGAKKTPRDVLKLAGRAIFMCLLVPFLLVFGILGSNAVLASICNAIKGDNDLTIGGLIFTASAYEANKFREYASDGLRVPITLSTATEVVNPGNYSSVEDMQVLFYKLAKGQVYISAISDDEWFINNKASYSSWTSALTAEDVEIDASKLMGNTAFSQFKSDFKTFNEHYFQDGGKIYTLSEFNMFNPIIKSIYQSNWVNNRSLTDLTYDFSSTYTTQREVEFNSRDGKANVAHIIVNSDGYQTHEKFATIELEYFVMADLIDYAIEQNETFYYVNASNNMIRWSDIVLNAKKPDEKINIEEYNNQYLIAKSESSSGYIYQGMAYPVTTPSVEDLAKEMFGSEVDVVAESAFIVRYYNGLNRLYWSESGATSEDEGATYIICTKTDDGFYIPVTQTTTKFDSAFLAEDYGGPIVARGIFQSESLIPKEYCLPTSISEQIVDDQGNELKNIDRTSPFALSDSYTESTNVGSVMSEFCGKLYDFTGGVAFQLLEGLFEKGSDAYKNWEQTLKDDLMNNLAEDDVVKDENGNDVRTGNLLINPNIEGYTYGTNSENKKTVTFYDYNGRKITAGSAYQNAEQTEFELTDKSEYGKTAYLVLQKEMFGDIVIPWYFSDATSLGQIAKLIAESEINTNDYTFLVAEYTYDNIQIQLAKTFVEGSEQQIDTYRMLLNFNIKNIHELNRIDTGFTARTSGEFIVTDNYSMLNGYDIMIEKKANLVVSGGEIFYSNGTLFYGKEDARKLYTNFMSDYLQTALTTSIMGYIDDAEAQVQFEDLQRKLHLSKKSEYMAEQEELHRAEILAIMEDNSLTDAMKMSKINEIRATFDDGYESDVIAGFMASDFRAGLASLISEFGKSYYTVEEKVSVDNEGNPITTGTIKYYNQNNQEMPGTSVTYAEKNYVQGYTITQRLAVVGGAKRSLNPSFVAVVGTNYATTGYTVVLNSNDELTNAVFGIIESVQNTLGTTITQTDVMNRLTWYYDVTYTFSFWEYKNSSGNVVAVLGINIDSVDLDFAGTNNDVNVDPGYLKIKNNGIYSNQLGKYILTANGVKNYIANEVDTATRTKNIGTNLDVKLTAGVDESGHSIATSVASNSSLSKMTATIFNIKSQSEYNNIYTYFSRGNLDWTMLFDFCINLPTINWNPFTLRFVFRCRLGTSYNYSESVIYRLQGGMFYLDYNFRNSTGIGMQNLFRMSAINPFILIFSTVLVLSIIWKTVWGLIRRIYDIVLLFIMLPAVCSTMPMDEGGRFTTWRKELVEQVLAAYSVLITLNIYFVLVPIVKDVTSDLITAGDLPTTITGMFSSITAGVSGFMGMISNIGTKLVGAVKSVGLGINNLCGNIGISNLMLDSELTTAQQSILGHVNSIVYIMFFLVLTTMLSNGKALIEKILDLGKLEGNVDAEALGNLKNVTTKAKNVVSKPVGLAAKGIGTLANGAVKLGSKAFGAMVTNKQQMQTTGRVLNGGQTSTGTSNGAQAQTVAPLNASNGSSQVQTGTSQNASNGSAQAVANTGQSQIQVPPGQFDDTEIGASGEQSNQTTGGSTTTAIGTHKDYGFQSTGADYATVDANYSGKSDDDINADIDDLIDMKAGEVSTIRSTPVENGAVKDGKFMSLDQYDDAMQEATDRLKNIRDNKKKLDAERIELQDLQKEGKLESGAMEEWRERNDKNNQEKAKATADLDELKKYEGSYTQAREKEAEITAQYDKEISALESYRDTRKANADAQAELEKDAKASGLTTEDYTKMNDLLGERQGLEEMKSAVDTTFSTDEERAAARAEIDSEVKRVDGEIDAIKSKASKEANGGVTGYQEEAQLASIANLGINMDKEQVRSMSTDALRDEIDARYKTSQTAIKDEIDASVSKFGDDATLEGIISSKTASEAEKATAQAELDMRKDLASQRDQNTSDYANIIKTQMARDEFKAGTSGTADTAQTAETETKTELSVEQLKAQLEAAKNDKDAKKFESEEARQSAIASLEKEIQAKESASETSNGATSTSQNATEKPTGNAGLSDEALTDKIINGKVLPYVRNEQFRKDHEGMTAEQYKAEEDRVRQLEKQSMADFDKRDAMYAQIEADKKKGADAATETRNAVEQKISTHTASGQGITPELQAELDKAVKAQADAAAELAKVSADRKQNQKDKESAGRRFTDYARTLKVEGEGKGIYNKQGGTTASVGATQGSAVSTGTQTGATSTSQTGHNATGTSQTTPASAGASPTQSASQTRQAPAQSQTNQTATSNTSTQSTTASSATPKKKGTVKKIAKGVGVGAAVAAAAFVAPAPLVVAVAGGVLGVKSVKTAKDKIPQTKFGKAVSGKVTSAKNFIGKHPKAKAFAKTAATSAGLSLVSPVVGAGYAVGKGVGAGVNAIKKKVGKPKSQPTPPPVAGTPSPRSGPAPTVGGPGRGPAPAGGPNGPGGPHRPSPHDKHLKDELEKTKKEMTEEITKLKKKVDSVEKNAFDVGVQLKRTQLAQKDGEKRTAQKMAETKAQDKKQDQQDAQTVQKQIADLEKKIAQTEAKTKAETKQAVAGVDKKVDKVQQDVDFITDYAGGLEDEIKKVKTTSKSSSTRERMKDLYTDDGGKGQEMVKNAADGLAKHRAETESKNPLNKDKK